MTAAPAWLSVHLPSCRDDHGSKDLYTSKRCSATGAFTLAFPKLCSPLAETTKPIIDQCLVLATHDPHQRGDRHVAMLESMA
jgi:hypothetical protein